jgi:hypothetical protein
VRVLEVFVAWILYAVELERTPRLALVPGAIHGEGLRVVLGIFDGCLNAVLLPSTDGVKRSTVGSFGLVG